MSNSNTSFKCGLCFEICREALECSRCQKVFCKNCSSYQGVKRCPLCSQTTMFQDFRLNSSFPIKRKLETTIDDLFDNEHKQNCIESIVNCSLCQKNLKKFEFLNHLSASHLLQIDNKIDKINEMIGGSMQNNEYSISSQINQISGRCARLGITGKYYCGGTINQGIQRPQSAFLQNQTMPISGQLKNYVHIVGASKFFPNFSDNYNAKTNCQPSNCINTICGFKDGCNCLGCMKLDVKFRRLPKGWLVNSDGFAAVKSSLTGLFYCGRRVINLNACVCDGYCCPNSGPNCESCKRLDSHARIGGMYESLI